ncbi:hypothetical protein D7X87_16320 [bacterium D16-54]|nr:hypothetical protein D7X87_16320 [bacterium D16-54]RKJ13443.1 hypothetical protein D7X65_16455 [bacterium D16-56]
MEIFTLALPYLLFSVCCSVLMVNISKSWYSSYKNRINLIRLFLLESSLICIIVVFCSFRTNVILPDGRIIGGNDTLNYKNLFHSAYHMSYLSYLEYTRQEPLYCLLAWSVARITHSFQIMLVIIYISMSLCVIKYCKLIKQNVWYFWGNLCVMLLFLESFNTLRTIWALFLTIFVVDFLFRNKYKHAWCITFIASLIHITGIINALIIIIYYIIKHSSRRIVIKNVTLISLCYFILISFLIIIVPQITYGRYYRYAIEGGSFSSALFISYIYVMFCNITTRGFSTDIKNRNLLIIITIFMPFIILQLKYAMVYRIMLMVMPYIFLMILQIREFSKRSLKIPINCITILFFTIRILSFIEGRIYSLGGQYVFMGIRSE